MRSLRQCVVAAAGSRPAAWSVPQERTEVEVASTSDMKVHEWVQLREVLRASPMLRGIIGVPGETTAQPVTAPSIAASRKVALPVFG